MNVQSLQYYEISTRFVLSESEKAAALAEALETGVSDPIRIMTRAAALASNYAFVRDRLERLRAGAGATPADYHHPDKASAEQDHAKVQHQLSAMCRRFVLLRDEDETGISGTGVVATGVRYGNSRVALTWLTRFRSLSFYPDLLHVERIHGHSGRTRVVWLDDVEAARKLVSWFEPAGEAATAI